MTSRTKPTPNPGITGDLAGRALQSAVATGIIIPIIQYVCWITLIETPASSEFLSQPPHAWFYILIIGLLPPLMFITGVARAANQAGIAGGIIYVLMVLTGQQLFGEPALTVLAILGLMLGLFIFLAGKAIANSQNRRGGRGGMYR